MKKLLPLILVVFAVPALAGTETWKGVSLVDAGCSAKVKSEPDKHTAECAIACAQSGFGILSSDGTFLKFDESGNTKALSALKSTKKKDHLRVTVKGEREGDTIKVQSVSLD